MSTPQLASFTPGSWNVKLRLTAEFPARRATPVPPEMVAVSTVGGTFLTVTVCEYSGLSPPSSSLT